jgi:hypothetical protein
MQNRAPFSELCRVMGWGRFQGYDKLLKGESPIQVTRLGARYYVNAAELEQLVEQRGHARSVAE